LDLYPMPAAAAPPLLTILDSNCRSCLHVAAAAAAAAAADARAFECYVVIISRRPSLLLPDNDAAHPLIYAASHVIQ
jgi:hypothetical protein